MRVLLTSGAGFVGFHTAVDESDAYYDPLLKQAGLAHIGEALDEAIGIRALPGSCDGLSA